jgi:hypothetical protein
MSRDYTVQEGDCLSSIAETFGFFWETLWDHANNAELRQSRQDPNTLVPGDHVFIPDIRIKEEAGQTTLVHTFRLKGVPVYLNFRVLDEEGTPRAGVQYTLSVDGAEKKGVTPEDGLIAEVIPPKAAKATLTLHDEDGDEEYEFLLGNLEPVERPKGLQARLLNLGYMKGDITGQIDDATHRALELFQLAHQMEPTGQPDDATLAALAQLHES